MKYAFDNMKVSLGRIFYIFILQYHLCNHYVLQYMCTHIDLFDFALFESHTSSALRVLEFRGSQ